MEKLSGGEKEIWWRTEGDKVWSLLLTHFQPFFQLLARILTLQNPELFPELLQRVTCSKWAYN